ncbi:MAG: DUF192 domain-containing protein [Spirochaetales bacterium]|nr:DUF192 domain-containing protein [Spirochaetales bacterium]
MNFRKNHLHPFLFVLTGFCSLFSCTQGLETKEILVGKIPLIVEVADDPDEREQGLMNRRHLKDNHGMLFVFESERQVSFWMKNTSLELSIAFVAADGTIRQMEDLEPHSLASVPSRRRVLYALEVNRGWFAEHGIEEGMKIQGL